MPLVWRHGGEKRKERDGVLSRFWHSGPPMESQEGKNSNLSDASSAKYDIQVGPALCASCAKNRFFFPVLKQLGRNRVLSGNHGFFSFRHWLLVEPLEWNEIRISGDLSSPLTRNRLSLCRRLLPNGIIGRLIPRSSSVVVLILSLLLCLFLCHILLIRIRAEKRRDNSFDVLGWCNQNTVKFLILSQVAKHVLVMPISTVASKSVFSTGGMVIDKYRSSLTAKTAKALICVQDWLRSTPADMKDMSINGLPLEEMVENLEKLELDMFSNGKKHNNSSQHQV
nr:zinc finger BED domain-containing protein RICESLEEPER 2-like [Tanacetum cinerariifolium]